MSISPSMTIITKFEIAVKILTFITLIYLPMTVVAVGAPALCKNQKSQTDQSRVFSRHNSYMLMMAVGFPSLLKRGGLPLSPSL